MRRGTKPPEITPAMFKEVFEDHPTGRIILDHLVLKFARPPVTDGGIDAVLKTYMRMGQRAALDYIVNQINRANGVETTEGEADANA